MGSPSRYLAVTATLLALAISAPALAADPGAGGAAAEASGVQRRVVHRFDFNERELGNFEPMPMNWFRVEAPGFPRYTQIGFNDEHAVAGEESLRLRLDGGSAAAVLGSGTLAVMPDAKYLVTAQVRTADAVHSRARVTAVFLDERNQPLLETRTDSAPVASNDRWTPVQLQLPPTPAEAAWLVLRLELLQPQQLRPTGARRHELVRQDIDASAWFDDVMIYRLPRIELATQSPVNVVRRPERPRFKVAVSDLKAGALEATLTVYDAAGNIVGSERRDLDDARTGAWEFVPELPALGWYWAELRVHDGRALIGHGLTAVSYLPRQTARASNEAERFMVLIEQAGEEHRDLAPAMMQQVGEQGVLVNLWDAEMSREELAAAGDRPDPLVAALLNQGRAVSLGLGEAPQELALAAGADMDDPLSLFADDAEPWQGELMALLALYGHQVERWHIGRVDNDKAFWRDDLAELHAAAREVFARYVAEPQLVVPWRATHGLTAASHQVEALVMDLPTSVRPTEIPAYMQTWADHPAERTVHLQPLDPSEHTHEARATDLALRMIHLWRERPERMAITRPWREEAGPPPSLMPDPLLGVWVNVAEQLAGRHFIETINLGPGIRAHLLDGPGGGVMVAWNESSAEAEAALDLSLGREPVAVDIYGNRTPLAREGDRQRLTLTQSPQFIEQINMALARLRAGFELDEPFIDSVHSRHERTLRIPNPWPRTISGRLRITGPERWEIQPGLVNFSIPAGQTLDVPLTLTFPISELAGDKRLTAEVEIEADRTYELELAAPMMVGLEDVEFHATASTQPSPGSPGEGEDVVVTIVVTNVGEAERSFYAFAMAPDHPRNERIISGLEPGQTIVRRFRFAGAAEQLSGRDIRVGLRQSDGPAVLNNRVRVP